MKGDQRQRRVGQAIRQRREALRISQEGFADKVVMHRTYYSAVERGERNLTVKSLLRISDGLGVKLAEIFSDADV